MNSVHNNLRSLIIILSIFVLGCSRSAFGIGIIVPHKPTVAPPVLKTVSIKGAITNHVAKTRVSQTFYNPNASAVEADFYFPVPDGADISDFVLYMDGKPVRGEVLDKAKAKEIYRDIVRQLKDPGLIEWSEKNLFRVRIFPIPPNGDQKLDIELTESLKADQGYYEYELPLSSGKHHAESSRPQIDLDFIITAAAPVRNVYSPTHRIEVETTASEGTRIKLKDEGLEERENFLLFYEATAADMSISLMAHRPTNADGYFSLRISPPWEEADTSPLAGDYIFVIDTSGSMSADDKIKQAKSTLQYCINLLKPADRFNIVSFSSAVRSLSPGVEAASPDKISAAKTWIDTLEARGGTNISEALETALQMPDDFATSVGFPRLTTVIFITDGLPTVGQTSPDQIIKLAEEKTADKLRIFTFGVGNDVNTRLLDSLAEKTKAASEYVAPQTDLEVPISRFFDKVSRPALIDPKLEIAGISTADVFPPDLPDLFYGTDISIFGKYLSAGATSITLRGRLGNEEKTYSFTKVFPAKSDEHAFVEKLWATRKVAWLLDQLRNAGESEELKAEITELGKKYSIVTPYTSYLAVEDKSSGDIVRHHGSPVPITGAPTQRHAAPAKSEMDYGHFASAQAFESESGAAAVSTARRLRSMKSSDKLFEDSNVRTVGEKTFHLRNNVWVDTQVTGNEETVVTVKPYSEAWFALVDNFPQIRPFLEVGEKVKIRMSNGSVLVTDDTGIDSIELRVFQQLGLRLKEEK